MLRSPGRGQGWAAASQPSIPERPSGPSRPGTSRAGSTSHCPNFGPFLPAIACKPRPRCPRRAGPFPPALPASVLSWVKPADCPTDGCPFAGRAPETTSPRGCRDSGCANRIVILRRTTIPAEGPREPRGSEGGEAARPVSWPQGRRRTVLTRSCFSARDALDLLELAISPS